MNAACHVRAKLIAAGALRPSPDVPPRLVHLTIGLPFDDIGRAFAKVHILEGHHGRRVLFYDERDGFESRVRDRRRGLDPP